MLHPAENFIKSRNYSSARLAGRQPKLLVPFHEKDVRLQQGTEDKQNDRLQSHVRSRSEMHQRFTFRPAFSVLK